MQKGSERAAEAAEVVVHQELRATGARPFPPCCAPTLTSGHLWPGLHFGVEYAGRSPTASSPPAYTPTPRTALLPPSPYKGSNSHKLPLQHVQAQQYTLKRVSSKNIPDKTDAKIDSVILCLQRSRVLLRLSTAHRESAFHQPYQHTLTRYCLLIICTSRSSPRRVSECWAIMGLGFLPLRGNSIFLKK